MRPPPLHFLLVSLLIGIVGHAEAPSTDPNPACARERKVRSQQSRYPHADKKCIEETNNAEDCCRQPNQEKCGYKESNFGNQRLSAENDTGAYAAGLRQSRDLSVSANRNRAFGAVCTRLRKKASDVCARSLTEIREARAKEGPLNDRDAEEYRRMEEETRDYGERADGALRSYANCHRDQATQNETDLTRSLDTVNASGGDAQWKRKCILSNIGGEETSQCFIYNNGNSTGNIVSDEQRRDLPMDTAQIGGCTGVIESGTTGYSAAHCRPGPRLSTDVDPVTGQPRSTVWNPKSEAAFNDADFKAGRPFNDVRRYDLEDGDPTRGKPFYALSEDASLSSGCQVRDERILACSPAALSQIQGTTAVIQGNPSSHFSRDPAAAGYLDPSRDVVVATGPAFYDSNSRTVNINAYSASGNSGGADYFPAGTNIGGVTVDRPVLINPHSGGYSSPTNPLTGIPYDGDALVFTPRAGFTTVSSYNTIRDIYVPQVSNSTLKSGAPLFGAPRPATGAR
jgi:hypothetical protein